MQLFFIWGCGQLAGIGCMPGLSGFRPRHTAGARSCVAALQSGSPSVILQSLTIPNATCLPLLIFAAMNTQGKIIIITAPSGAGKTSITRYLLQQFPWLTFSISAATRQPRGAEVHGKDYYFISEDDFRQKIQHNEFLEWEMVYEGKYYGTLKSEMDRIWGEGKTPILDIDVKGAIHVQQQYPGRCLSLFIQAPSVEALKERLQGRGTETEESLATRISKASYEMSFRNKFDAIIVNDNLEKAQKETAELVKQFLQG